MTRKRTVVKPPSFQSIAPKAFLSFGPRAEPIALQPLNVLIGPNGSGKSNFIEAFEFLRATAGDLAGLVRQGGGASEFLWKGARARERRRPVAVTGSVPPIVHMSPEAASTQPASLEAVVTGITADEPLRYHLEFTEKSQRLEIIDEALEKANLGPGDDSGVSYFYRFRKGQPIIKIKPYHQGGTGPAFPTPPEDLIREFRRDEFDPHQSVLSQRREPDLYPALTSLARFFERIATFREWSFGSQNLLRAPQRADLDTDVLLPHLANLGLVLNTLEQTDRWEKFNSHVRRFLPRFSRLSTRVQAGHVQVNLHEEGLREPIPATRLSDGTLRFIALLAVLLRPEAASLICIEEPELGLHPDAVALLAPLLVEASHVTQTIVTTHSDTLVSALTERPDSVIVADYLGDGTHLRRLDPKSLADWLEKYRLGEIWLMGELGGNP